MTAGVRIERDGPLLHIVLDRDAKRNAVSQPMLATLTRAVVDAAADARVGAVVLRGEGRDFCAGEDVRGFDLGDLASASRFLEGPTRFFEQLEILEKPVCVAVHGHALGFGSEVLLTADVVVAHPGSTFGFAEIDHGAVPSVLMTRGVGSVRRRRAISWALTGRRFGALEALGAGLVHLVDPDPVAVATDWARRMATYEPAATAMVRSVLGIDAFEDHDLARDVMPAVLLQTRAAI